MEKTGKLLRLRFNIRLATFSTKLLYLLPTSTLEDLVKVFLLEPKAWRVSVEFEEVT